MATRNGPTATVSKKSIEEQARPIAEEQERLEGNEGGGSLVPYLEGRKKARRIKVNEAPETHSLEEAAVTTTKGLPDFRFAKNRNLFLRDKSKRVNGRPDLRLVENRADILALHEMEGDGMPNVIFAEDEEGEE